jgi:hypothetical protein
MAALIEEEGLDEDGRPTKQQNLHRPRKHKCTGKQAKKAIQEAGSDDSEDGDFLTSGSDSGSASESESGSDGLEVIIPTDEVRSCCLHCDWFLMLSCWTQIADMLPSKTAPSAKRTKSMTCSRRINSRINSNSKAKSPDRASKRPRKAIEDLDADDEDGPQVSARNHTAIPDPPSPDMTGNTEQQKKVSLLIDTEHNFSQRAHPRRQVERNVAIQYTYSTKLFPKTPMASWVTLATSTIDAVMETTRP